MLLILLSWFYILSVSSVIGVSIYRLLKIDTYKSIIPLFFGFFGITILASIWAIPFAIDMFFQLFLIIVSVGLGVLYKNEVHFFWKQLIGKFLTLSAYLKIFLIIISILILAQSASVPFIIDNESYYIQTIKWLNEYGFVNGLVNLHIFLGQTSGWHILQSTFNFSFIYENFNDLSALTLLLGNVYAAFRLQAYFSEKNINKQCLTIGLFPLANVFFFQFISSPSPDIAIYVLSFIVIHQFINCYKNYDKQAFYTVVILTLFMTYIKLYALPFCLFPLILYKRNFIFTRKTTPIIILFSCLTFFLFFIKNIIITGNLFFPIQGIQRLNASWSLPETIATYFSNYTKPYAYHLTMEAFEEASTFGKLKSWFFAPSHHGLFNKLIAVLLVISPFIINKLKERKAIYNVYFVSLTSMLFLFLTSPQYRFFFPFILFFSLLIASIALTKKNALKFSLIGSTILVIIPLFFNINNDKITNNKHLAVSSSFKIEYLIFPHKNSKYSESFEVIQLKNTQINLSKEIDFFWGTGNLPLPALNKEQLDFFKVHFKVIPQQRGESLKDGFYSKKVSE